MCLHNSLLPESKEIRGIRISVWVTFSAYFLQHYLFLNAILFLHKNKIPKLVSNIFTSQRPLLRNISADTSTFNRYRCFRLLILYQAYMTHRSTKPAQRFTTHKNEFLCVYLFILQRCIKHKFYICSVIVWQNTRSKSNECGLVQAFVGKWWLHVHMALCYNVCICVLSQTVLTCFRWPSQ
jgi:hypothetical protein